MRRLVLAAAAAAAFAAAPVHAMPAEQRNCPVGKLASGFDVQLADALVSKDDAILNPKMEMLTDAVTACVVQFGIDADTAGTLFTYSVGRLATPIYASRLRAAGIPTGVIDEALGIGKGSGPSAASELTDSDWDKVFEALTKAGVDVDGLDPDKVKSLAGYVATIRLYREGEVALRD